MGGEAPAPAHASRAIAQPQSTPSSPGASTVSASRRRGRSRACAGSRRWPGWRGRGGSDPVDLRDREGGAGEQGGDPGAEPLPAARGGDPVADLQRRGPRRRCRPEPPAISRPRRTARVTSRPSARRAPSGSASRGARAGPAARGGPGILAAGGRGWRCRRLPGPRRRPGASGAGPGPRPRSAPAAAPSADATQAQLQPPSARWGGAGPARAEPAETVAGRRMRTQIVFFKHVLG